jgi:hypothetical protein
MERYSVDIEPDDPLPYAVYDAEYRCMVARFLTRGTVKGFLDLNNFSDAARRGGYPVQGPRPTSEDLVAEAEAKVKPGWRAEARTARKANR